jgi:hypothetical protein
VLVTMFEIWTEECLKYTIMTRFNNSCLRLQYKETEAIVRGTNKIAASSWSCRARWLQNYQDVINIMHAPTVVVLQYKNCQNNCNFFSWSPVVTTMQIWHAFQCDCKNSCSYSEPCDQGNCSGFMECIVILNKS